MAFSESSRIGDLLKSDAAKIILDKHFPGFTANSRLDLAKGFTLKAMSAFPESPITADRLKACLADLENSGARNR